jgi:putative DNA primase/helicase
MIDIPSIDDQSQPAQSLSAEHAEQLRLSAIEQHVHLARGVRTIETKAQLKSLGFSESQCSVPGLLFPIHDVFGEIQNYQFRPDIPRIKDGKPVKYETCSGKGVLLDISPIVRSAIKDPSKPLWITEGSKKVDAAISKGLTCIGVLGVYNWRGTNADGGATALPDWEEIAIKNRTVYLAFDSDAWTNLHVAKALDRLGDFLKRRGAHVLFVKVPTPDGRKVGLDDYFASGGSVASLLECVTDAAPRIKADAASTEREPLDMSELGMARRFVKRHHDKVHYVASWGGWVYWTGCQWAKGKTSDGPAVELVIEAIESLHSEYEDMTRSEKDEFEKKFRAYKDHRKIASVVSLAKSLPGVAVSPDAFDADTWILNTPTGVVDLRTGILMPHDPSRLVTKITRIGYDGDEEEFPRFEQFLSEITTGDQDLTNYLWRLAGYLLTGDTRHEEFYFLHGNGANGKSKFVGILRHILGDYAVSISSQVMMMKGDVGPATDQIASTQGARMAIASEVPQNASWNENLIKDITGRDSIRVAFKYQNSFEFVPSLKLVICGNFKPTIRGADPAFWRRVKMIPFDAKFEGAQRDEALFDKLLAEAPVILRWMVLGCLEWQRSGMGSCARVEAAIEEYKEEEDKLGMFLNECTYPNSSVWTKASALYDRYKKWCEANGLYHESQFKFAKAMQSKGKGSEIWPGDWKSKAYRGLAMIDPDEAHRSAPHKEND